MLCGESGCDGGGNCGCGSSGSDGRGEKDTNHYKHYKHHYHYQNHRYQHKTYKGVALAVLFYRPTGYPGKSLIGLLIMAISDDFK